MTAPSQVLSATLSHAGPWASGRPALGAHPVALAPLLDSELRKLWGTGRIAGTVKVVTTPSPGHRVRLYDKASGALVRETMSDGAGLYAFENLITHRMFYVTAEYTTASGGAYNATIEDFVVPA